MNLNLRVVAKPDFKARLAATKKSAAKVLQKAAHVVESRAQLRAPVDTGRLRNSIGAHQTAPLAWEVRAATHYAAHVEYGTRSQRAQPYLRPAAADARRALKEDRL